MAAIKAICVNIIFMAEWYPSIWLRHHLLNYYSAVGCLGCFLFFIIMSRMMIFLLEHKRKSSLRGALMMALKRRNSAITVGSRVICSSWDEKRLCGVGVHPGPGNKVLVPQGLCGPHSDPWKRRAGPGACRWVHPRGSPISRMMSPPTSFVHLLILQIFIEHLLCAPKFFFQLVVIKVGFLDQQHQQCLGTC